MKVKVCAHAARGFSRKHWLTPSLCLQAATYRFSTLDPRVNKFFFERHPWLAIKMPALVTHRAAVQFEVRAHRTIARSTLSPLAVPSRRWCT